MTVQAEAARCFLCGRSATSCGTCALFRRSLVNGLGYCANDPRREPLSGAEQRGCWTAPSAEALVPDSILIAPTGPPPASGRRLIELG
jgi:hypothetical protein